MLIGSFEDIIKRMKLAKVANWGMWGAFALVGFSLALRCGIHIVSHNYNLAAEANGLYGILSFDAGENLYPTHETRPYFVYVYPPLHAWISASLLKCLPWATVHGKVMAVRFLSLVAFLGSLVLIWKVILKPYVLSFPLFCVACALGLSKFADYVTTARNDMLYLLLNVLSLATFLLYLRGSRKKLALSLFLLFSLFTFMTRPSGLSLFGATILYLLLLKRWRVALSLGALFSVLDAAFIFVMSKWTNGAFIEHVFLANLRPNRPIDASLFDASLVSFIATYIVFSLLVILGLQKRKIYSESSLLLLIILTNLGFAGLFFLRAGGDVNYFFDAIFFSLGFCTLGLQKAVEKKIWVSAIAIQLLVIAFVYAAKSRSALRFAFIPYEEIANQVKALSAPYGELYGYQAASFAVHLRGWAYHGPDVTSGALIVTNSHRSMRWLLSDLKKAAIDKTIKAFIYVEPGCDQWKAEPPAPPFHTFQKRVVLQPWLCAYLPPPETPQTLGAALTLEK